MLLQTRYIHLWRLFAQMMTESSNRKKNKEKTLSATRPRLCPTDFRSMTQSSISYLDQLIRQILILLSTCRCYGKARSATKAESRFTSA
ncbi:hypothetical protein NPIL_131581 [Nephila pilipes]|uniref:Uncharacterized protein n=1 Tax=Nephila pilipes TaxID=299642 RepID=A0A8X6UEA3_NEPPI|nr:hypothetical protein NPIL_131581 [Nephila pilipes]